MNVKIVEAQTSLSRYLTLLDVDAAIAIDRTETTLEVFVRRAQDADNVPVSWLKFPVVTSTRMSVS